MAQTAVKWCGNWPIRKEIVKGKQKKKAQGIVVLAGGSVYRAAFSRCVCDRKLCACEAE